MFEYSYSVKNILHLLQQFRLFIQSFVSVLQDILIWYQDNFFFVSSPSRVLFDRFGEQWNTFFLSYAECFICRFSILIVKLEVLQYLAIQIIQSFNHNLMSFLLHLFSLFLELILIIVILLIFILIITKRVEVNLFYEIIIREFFFLEK